jgi:hypothetical protein
MPSPNPSPASSGRAARREALARLLCAEHAGMFLDPLGARLPADLWRQCLDQADAVLMLVGARVVTA